MVKPLTLVAVLQDGALQTLQDSMRQLEGQPPTAKVYASFPPENLHNTLKALQALQQEVQAVLVQPELVSPSMLHLLQSTPQVTLVLVGTTMSSSSFFTLANAADPSAVHLLLLKLQAKRMAARIPVHAAASPTRSHGANHLTLQQPSSPMTTTSPFASADVPESLFSTPGSSARYTNPMGARLSSSIHATAPSAEANTYQLLRPSLTTEITPVSPGNAGVVTHVRHPVSPATALKPQRLFDAPQLPVAGATSGAAPSGTSPATLLQEVQRLKQQFSTRLAGRQSLATTSTPPMLQLPHASTSPEHSPSAHTTHDHTNTLTVARSLPATPPNRSPSRERHPSLEELARSHSARRSPHSPMRERMLTRMIVSSGGGAEGNSGVEEACSTISRSSSFLSSSTARYRPRKSNRYMDDESDGGVISRSHSDALPAPPSPHSTGEHSTVDVTIGSAAGANSAAGDEVIVSPVLSEAGCAASGEAADESSVAGPTTTTTTTCVPQLGGHTASSSLSGAPDAADVETSQESISFPIMTQPEPQQEAAWMSPAKSRRAASAPVSATASPSLQETNDSEAIPAGSAGELIRDVESTPSGVPSPPKSAPQIAAVPQAPVMQVVKPGPAPSAATPPSAAATPPSAAATPPSAAPTPPSAVVPPPAAAATPPSAAATPPAAAVVTAPPLATQPARAVAPSPAAMQLDASTQPTAASPIKPAPAVRPISPLLSPSSPGSSPRAITSPQPWPLPPSASPPNAASPPKATAQTAAAPAAPPPRAEQQDVQIAAPAAAVAPSQVTNADAAQRSVGSKLAAAAGGSSASAAFGSLQVVNEAEPTAGKLPKAREAPAAPVVILAAPVVPSAASQERAPKPPLAPASPKPPSSSVPQPQAQPPSPKPPPARKDRPCLPGGPLTPSPTTATVPPLIQKPPPQPQAVSTTVPVTTQFTKLGLPAEKLIPFSYRTASGMQPAALLAVDMPTQGWSQPPAARTPTAAMRPVQPAAGQLAAPPQVTNDQAAREHKKLARQRLKSHAIYVSEADLF